MLNTIFGLVIAFAITAFALWCYIKGEHNGFKIAKGEQPEQIKSPVQVVSDAVQNAKKSAESKGKGLTYTQKIQNMMNYDPTLPTDKKD